MQKSNKWSINGNFTSSKGELIKDLISLYSFLPGEQYFDSDGSQSYVSHKPLHILMKVCIDGDTESDIAWKYTGLASEEIKQNNLSFAPKFFYSNVGRLHLGFNNSVLKHKS